MLFHDITLTAVIGTRDKIDGGEMAEVGSKSLADLYLPWKVRIPTVIMSSFTDLVRRRDGRLNRSLISLIETRVPQQSKPLKGIRTTDTVIDPTRNLWFRLFTPIQWDEERNFPFIIFFHGGGFTFLSPDSKPYDVVCRRMARKLNAVIVSVNYRLTPEHRYPAPYEDGYDVAKWIDDHVNTDDFPVKVDVSKTFFAGDSAGANIAHHVTRRICESKPSEFKTFRILGLISIQPFFGGEEVTKSEKRLQGAPIISIERTNWHWKAFLPEGSDRDHEACNVFGPRSTSLPVTGFPATMLAIGGFDPLQDWQRKYCEGLKSSGVDVALVEYPDAIHAFYVFADLPESSLLITDMKNFIDKQLNQACQ